MTGVNLAGLEFKSSALPGAHYTDYITGNPAEMQYYRTSGARILRLPFVWERMQPALNGAFDAAYAKLIDDVVDSANGLGMKVLLDAHNYGRRNQGGTSVIIGETATVTAEHFAQFWGAMAARYRSKSVIFGLMNEPHDQNVATLVTVQNSAIAAIRQNGAAQLVLASGGAWSGAHSWVSSGNGAALLGIVDSANNTAYDVHQYLDSNSSGGSGTCVSASGERLEAFTAWARQNNKKGFLGEFGAGIDSACASELTAMLQHMRDNRDVWLGWTYWAGGAWWAENYHFNIRPASLTAPVDRAQMTVLKTFFE